eukprot:TRINITY_DN24218_c0_g1_i3.p1 TRINITY_DN24218_c0_g1~~TRINITY_DN24218_c0_g1_i3.p1  ORF type:complete len:197 (-),score=68.11 TRINITY_DN24218_c0_g1_i3:122-643(-)
MAPPSAPPISPHEESPPPPPYSEVAGYTEHECDDMATQTVTSDRHKTAVLYSILSVAFVVLVVMGCMVGDLWMRLNTLQDTVEEINTRKVESVKLKLESLAVNVDNITLHNEELNARLDQLADKVDRLQLQKEGQLHYVMVAQVTPLQPDVQLMLFLSVCSWLTPTSYYNLVL